MSRRFAEQTQAYTEVGGDIPGDCWRTAVACLLEVERDEVPHFAHEHGDRWFESTVEWVEERLPGFTLGAFEPSFPIYAEPELAPQRVILSGRSPRGDWLHAVIADARTGALVWDVHPDRTGVLSHVDVIALTHRPEADA